LGSSSSDEVEEGEPCSDSDDDDDQGATLANAVSDMMKNGIAAATLGGRSTESTEVLDMEVDVTNKCLFCQKTSKEVP